MSDAEKLFLVLAAFYVFECAYWVRPGALAFVSQWGFRHRAHPAATRALLRNDRGGLLFGNLFPWGDSALCRAWPASVSPEGVLAYESAVLTPDGRPDHPGVYLRFADAGPFTAEGRHVHSGGKRLLSTPSPESARPLAEFLESLRAAPPESRAAAVDAALAAALDGAEAARRYRLLREASLGLSVACSALFLYLFVGLPLCLTLRVSVDLVRGLLAYLGLLALVLAQFAAASSAMPPGTRPTRHLFLMFVSPANALHARDQLFRDLLAPFHPLAAARALCTRGDFVRLARHALLDLRAPLPPVCPTDDPEACAAEAWYRGRLFQAVGRSLRRAGLGVADLSAAPTPEGPDARAYCPRCLGQYVRGEGDCNACRGIPLVVFDEPSGPPRLPDLEPDPLPPPPTPIAAPAAAPPAAPKAPAKARKGRGKRRRKGGRGRSDLGPGKVV